MTPTDPLDRIRRAAQAEKTAHREKIDAVLAALRAGLRQRDVAEASGYTRERLRQLAREAGIPSARPNKTTPAAP